MSENLPKILITLRIGGENGGPYISHKRIIESSLSEKYDIKPFFIENPRVLRKPKCFFGVLRKLRNEKPALVHIAGLGSEGFLVMLACRLSKVKTVVAVHGSATEAIGYSGFSKAFFKFIESYTVKKANAVYGVSDYVSSWEICRKARNYIGTVYNIPAFAGQKQATPYIRGKLGIKEDDIVFASTGRITRDKGFDTLLEVIKSLSDNEKIKFIIAGDGEYFPTLKSEISAAGLEGKAFLLGYRSDIDEILKESDAFIICTKHETLCISLLEAAHNSLPLIASNVGGIPEIITDGENGRLIPPYDTLGFSAAVSELSANMGRRLQMGIKAKNIIEKKFSEKEITAKLDGIYKSLLIDYERLKEQ